MNIFKYGKTWFVGPVLTFSVLSPIPANAAYPARPITIVVPFGTGSGSDIQARFIANVMAQELKATVLVENRPGANAMIGAEYVAKAAPDGYTLLFGSGTANAANYSMYPKNIKYSPDSFATIALISKSPVLLFAPTSSKYGDIRNVLSTAAKNPAGLSCGSGNTITQVACDTLKTKTNVFNVPYKGNSQSVTDLAGGQINIAFSDMIAASALVHASKITPLAIAASDRLDVLPDVPTFEEQGLKGFNFISWGALFAPAGTPTEIVLKLNSTARKAIASDDWETQRKRDGALKVTEDLNLSKKWVDDEIIRWKQYIQTMGSEG